MTNRSEVVSVHVSGGSEDESNPGLNIIGGVQPRGLRESIPGISGIPDGSTEVEWFIDMVEDGPDVSELIGESMGMSCISRSFSMSVLNISGICGISDMVADGSDAVVMLPGSIPRSGPHSRMLSGRHCTLPLPLAKILSTQDGKAPVSIYRANMTSESSCVQSFRRTFIASRSTARSVASSSSF
jgi:hypothetical protein